MKFFPLLNVSFELIIRLFGKINPSLKAAFFIADPETPNILPISEYDLFSKKIRDSSSCLLYVFTILFYYKYFGKQKNRTEQKISFIYFCSLYYMLVNGVPQAGLEPTLIQLHYYALEERCGTGANN